MSVSSLIKTSEYHDSVSLMIVAKELLKVAGVEDASVMMGTDAPSTTMGLIGSLNTVSCEVEVSPFNDSTCTV